jgi:hypothetical protein
MPFYIWSSGSPLFEILGETACWVMNSLHVCRGLKSTLGGFFMAVYRLILMKRPNIAMNVRSQRRITYELVFLEWITLILLLSIFEVGKKLRGTNVIDALACTDQSMEITGTPEWKTSFGKQFQISVMVLLQIFMIAEFVMYIILFKDQYDHNKEQNGNSLGLSADTLRKRQKKNVITLFGQCFTFGVEIVMSFTIQFAIYLNFSPFKTISFLGTLVVASYFVASPELKRFYFKE